MSKLPQSLFGLDTRLLFGIFRVVTVPTLVIGAKHKCLAAMFNAISETRRWVKDFNRRDLRRTNPDRIG